MNWPNVEQRLIEVIVTSLTLVVESLLCSRTTTSFITKLKNKSYFQYLDRVRDFRRDCELCSYFSYNVHQMRTDKDRSDISYIVHKVL
jgi:hypothetical protein